MVTVLDIKEILIDMNVTLFSFPYVFFIKLEVFHYILTNEALNHLRLYRLSIS